MDQIEKKQMTNSSTVSPVKDVCGEGGALTPALSSSHSPFPGAMSLESDRFGDLSVIQSSFLSLL